MERRISVLVLVMGLVCSTVFAQTQTGSIAGTVSDQQGAVLPGVAVTLSGAQAPQTAFTVADGTYRFRGLAPGSYNVGYEIAGFQTLNREGIILAAARTITVDVSLGIATVAETITVTGESPVVDVKQTTVATSFDATALYDVPSATDTWAVLGQTPGIRMRGFDVGGSHKSQQISYESFGMRYQNQIISDGVNSTEGNTWAAIYYDYYAVEEYKVSAAGADIEMMTPGAAVVMTVKSGGNKPSALWHLDYENGSFVGDNVDDETRALGFTGNPNQLFWELHGDYGGPIIKDKLWIYAAYGHFKISKAVSGVDVADGTDDGIFNNYTGKMTWQLTDSDKFIGYTSYGRKEKPNRGLSAARPPENILGQDYYTWVHKAEWQRVWNDQFFTDFQLNHFGSVWPMTPKVDPVTHPPRIDLATSIQSGAGWHPFTARRWKPHINAIGNYYIPAAAGSHDLKFGWHWQIDREGSARNANSGVVRYRDRNGVPDQVRLVDSPVADPSDLFSVPDGTAVATQNRQSNFFIQDTWSISDRLVVTLGVRYNDQLSSYLDNVKDPQIFLTFPWAADLTVEDGSPAFFAGTVPGEDALHIKTFAPRFGLTYDVTGRGKTVAKFSFGRYNANVSQSIGGAHPSALTNVFYQFNDLNGDSLLSGPEEIGDFINRTGGGGGTLLDRVARFAYTDEIQFTVEHEIAADTAFRATFVRKAYKNAGADRGFSVNLAQAPFLSVPYQMPDPLTGQTLDLVTTPADVFGSLNTLTNYPDGGDSWTYDNVVFSVERRLTGNFFLQGSFDYQWRNEAKRADGTSTSPLTGDPIAIAWYQNHNPNVDGNNAETTNWSMKAMGRYIFPHDIAVSSNLRFQSGFPYSRIIRGAIYAGTGTNTGGRSLGTKSIFVEDLNNNRSESVPIVDVRLEKGFTFGTGTRFQLFVDAYNLLNDNSVHNFFLTTPNFGRIIAALDPRTIKIGIRLTF